jgi:hypothetical protein
MLLIQLIKLIIKQIQIDQHLKFAKLILTEQYFSLYIYGLFHTTKICMV